MRRSFLLLALSSSLLAGPSLAAKVAVFMAGTSPSAGVTAKEVAVLTDATAAAASRAGHDVVTQQQIEALVGLEAARQMVGCSDASCASEIGAALGVDAVLTVGVGVAGKSLIVTMKRTDVKGGMGKVADRRIPKKKGAIDAAFDALPALVGEALAGLPTTSTPTTAGAAATTTPATTPATTATTATKGKMPTVRAEVAAKVPPDLLMVDDGAGHLIAFAAKDGMRGPLFAGTAKDGLYALRLIGGGANGADFDVTFWDPRFRDGWQKSFSRKGDVFTLQCGDRAIPFSKPRAVVGGARFFEAPWQRQAVLIGRDDRLRYVVVDNSRADGVKDLHVYLGKKGKLVPLDVEVEDDPAFGAGGIIAVSDEVTIKLGPTGGTITEGTTTSKLSSLDLYDSAALIYRELQPWGDLPLGTPCDGR